MNTKKRKRKGRKGWERHSKAISSAGIAHKKKKETTKLFPGWALAVQVRTDDFVPP